MHDQKRKIEQFHRLHVAGDPLVLYNVWDPGSAQAVAQAGAKAIATSSWAVAKAHGFTDGEHTPLNLVIDNLRRIVTATDLPVTVDLESGYGVKPKNVGETIALAIESGAVGCNLEDSIPKSGAIREITDQVARIRSARQSADAASLRFFINARTDIFLQSSENKHRISMVAEAIKRAQAYAEAGADGLFVPGLTDITLISKLTEESSLPVNIMVDDDSSTLIASLAKNRVARVSYGAAPYVSFLSTFEEAARTALG